MELKIEPVKSEELPLLVDISRTTFYDTFWEQNTKEDMQAFLDGNFSSKVLKDEMLAPGNYFFFAKLDGEIAGYTKLSTEATEVLPGEDVLEIVRIYVIKDKLSAGIGKALMDFAISFARQNHKKTVYLGVWEHNERAISFYKKRGFVKFSEHLFMLGNDPQTDWLMKKDLTDD